MKIYYMINFWFEGKLEVRNSPTDKLATAAAKLFHCWKIGCEIGSTGLGIVGTGFLLYQILESGGKPKVFTPLIGSGVNFIIGGQQVSGTAVYEEITKDLERMENLKKSAKSVSDELAKSESYLNNNLFSKEDTKSFKQAFVAPLLIFREELILEFFHGFTRNVRISNLIASRPSITLGKVIEGRRWDINN